MVGRRGLLLGSFRNFQDLIRIIRNIRMEIRKENRIRVLLGYGILYAMRRHKAWHGGSKAPQSGVPATALALINPKASLKS